MENSEKTKLTNNWMFPQKSRIDYTALTKLTKNWPISQH